ncbi:methyltransferase domain-containing protein [Candidatus Binatia bacterium]|nr:methyltransferase domain-containing protein [Candidatus Binatia bacterium]
MNGTSTSRSQPGVWRAVWQDTHLTEEGVRKTIRREQRTLRWRAIRDALVRHFGGVRGLRTIELGAGTGDISLLLAIEGAVTTLLDANDRALDLARFKFGVAGLQPVCVTGDLLALDPELRGRFDVAVSYGTVEHFAGYDRELACRGHVAAVRPGGMVAISVPNAHCFPYRARKWWQETRGTWIWGLEIPYTRRELDRMASRIGLAQWFIHGSSFLRDWDQFLLNPVTARIERYTGFHFERRTPFDPYWGHALTLIGHTRDEQCGSLWR